MRSGMALDSDIPPVTSPKPLRRWAGIASTVCGGFAALVLVVMELAFKTWRAPSDWDISGGLLVAVFVGLSWAFNLLGLAFGLPAALSRRSNRVIGACGLLLNVGVLLYFRFSSRR